MITQFKKGIVELCVLKVVSVQDLYGFEVIEKLSEPLSVNENTIYPILRRLTNQGLFTTYEKSSSSGAKRKYYEITESGKQSLKEKLEEWYQFSKNIKLILGGNKNE
ncbi:MAG: PadR family transcriptional regulator [Acholeplasmatales bacterium]|jgi:PadR family transcriptional regulator PadR|nr:PadR family transcriptional regulator [Acholeplasmataceae bacterium]MCK9428315.1 PadR family transcriptional regulator [Acholeplasmataceae bacterium]MDY0115515.1 PadR family transcriptional regulator [Acholeplasmatales bacterium]